MSFLPLSKGKADAISNGVFLMSLGILLYTNKWWPWILLALCLMLMIRQLLTNRKFDMMVSLAIFGTLFVLAYFEISFSVLMPVLFVAGGAYLILREYLFSNGEPPGGK